MFKGLSIIEDNIVFENPKTMGLIGQQKNFILSLRDVVCICYLSTWFWDDEAEVLVFIDNHSNEFVVNLNYINENFYMKMSDYTNLNFAEEVNIYRNMLNKSAILYLTTQKSSIGKIFEIKWTFYNLIKCILNIITFKNPLYKFIKLTSGNH